MAADFQKAFESSSHLSDVTFVVEGERIPAHRIILASRCEYFSTMFSAGFQERDSNEIKMEGVSAAAFKALLQHLYTDHMEVEEGVLVEMVKVCDQYQVLRLRDHCIRRLEKDITEHNALEWLVQAHRLLGPGAVKRSMLQYVAHNYAKIRLRAQPDALALADIDRSLLLEVLDTRYDCTY